MSSVFISYIVPCYNIQAYLPRCIESLEKQQIPGFELEFVMINDGSSDATLSIIRQFAEKDHRVVVIDQPNQGVCAARNNGLSVAKGKYVFFLDGDDWLTDNASEIMYGFCKDSNPDIALFSNYKIQEGKPNDKAKMWVDCSVHIDSGVYTKQEYIGKTSYLPISFKLYRTEFLKLNGIVFDKQLIAGEVYTFFIHALVLSEKIAVCGTPVMYYLKRKEGSATTVINVQKDLSILDTLHVLNEYVREHYARLMERRSFLTSSFWLVTSFALIKYVGRTGYSKDIGQLIRHVKKDKEYAKLLKYFTGKGLSMSKHTLLALFIRFFSPRITYGFIRGYYKFATRNRNDD